MAQAPSRQRTEGAPVAAATSRGANPVQRLGAAGYDWLFDRVDPLGGADHHRRLVEQAAGEVLEIGAGTGRNLPRYRTATRVVALEPAPGMRARAHQVARTARVAVEVVDGTAEDLPFPDATSTRWSPAWCCARSPTQPGRWPRPTGSCAQAGRSGSTSTCGPTTRGWPAGRAGWSAPGAGSPWAATPTAPWWRPSPRPGSAC
jgi:hypothetical protein